MTGAELFLATLASWRVPFLFGLPGTTESALLEPLRCQERLRFILTLHEGIAVAMADGYARTAHAPGVVSLHTSVGTAGGLGQLINAWRDGSPVVVTAGHKDMRIQGRDGFCVLPDLPGLTRQMTKWSWQSQLADQVGEDLNRALHRAIMPPTGPTFLAVPENLLAAQTTALPPEAAGFDRAPAVRPGREEVERAAELLLAAERPALVVGRDVGRSGALAEAVELARLLGLPVMHEYSQSLTDLAYPNSDENYAGFYADDNPALAGADLLLVVGALMFMEFGGLRPVSLPDGVRLIHAHPDPNAIGNIHPALVPMVGTSPAVLADLVAAVRARGGLSDAVRAARKARVVQCHSAHMQALAVVAARQHDESPPRVSRLARELRQVAAADTVLVDEGVVSSKALRNHFCLDLAGSYHRTSGGALGWGLPFALGAKLAAPQRPVLAVVGDGSLHFSVQALWTAARYRIPVVVVVLNNGGYLSVRLGLESYVGGDARLDTPGYRIEGIDHVQVARGYGVHAARVGSVGELAPAVARALASGVPCLLDVAVADEINEAR